MARKLTTEEFIAKAKVVHGDTYNYSKVVYKTTSAKVIITCPEHGDFEQSPGNHLRNHGCPICAGQEVIDTEKFITKSEKIYGKLYTYNKTNYTNAKTKVTITCPIHGDWLDSPGNYLLGRGCPDCRKIKYTNLEFTKFTAKAKAVHKNKYDYSNVIYRNSNTLITITCPEHGDFEQTPHSHLKGHGCRICAGTNSYTTNEWVSKARAIHGSWYNYDEVEYINSITKVAIICPIHGMFYQVPETHVRGCKCPGCAKTGFDSTKAGYLYYLKITTEYDQTLYKIGITNKSVDERFRLKDLAKIEVVKQQFYQYGQNAYDEEQRILKQFKEYQYLGPKVLESGNTELFTIDVLGLE